MSLTETDIDDIRRVLSDKSILKEVIFEGSKRRQLVVGVAILYGSDSATALAGDRSMYGRLLNQLVVYPSTLTQAERDSIVSPNLGDTLRRLSLRHAFHASQNGRGNGLYLTPQPLLDMLFREDGMKAAARQLFTPAMESIMRWDAAAADLHHRTRQMRRALGRTFGQTALAFHTEKAEWNRVDGDDVKRAYDVLGELLRQYFPELLEENR